MLICVESVHESRKINFLVIYIMDGNNKVVRPPPRRECGLTTLLIDVELEYNN